MCRGKRLEAQGDVPLYQSEMLAATEQQKWRQPQRVASTFGCMHRPILSGETRCFVGKIIPQIKIFIPQIRKIIPQIVFPKRVTLQQRLHSQTIRVHAEARNHPLAHGRNHRVMAKLLTSMHI